MKLSSKILFRKEFDGTGILFDTENAKPFSLNKTSCFICEMLQKGAGTDEIVSALSKSAANVPDSVKKDVKAFIDDLISKGYVEE